MLLLTGTTRFWIILEDENLKSEEVPKGTRQVLGLLNPKTTHELISLYRRLKTALVQGATDPLKTFQELVWQKGQQTLDNFFLALAVSEKEKKAVRQRESLMKLHF